MQKLLLVVLFTLAINFSQSITAQPATPTVFVTTTWLAEHINDPSLVILNVAPICRDYERGHIPGARFLWSGWIYISNPQLSSELLHIIEI